MAGWADLTGTATALDIDVGELAWFADRRGRLRRAPDGPLHHHRRHWTGSASGSPRLIEAPAPRLQELRRRVARHVLRRIPVHDAAHGYLRGRSPHRPGLDGPPGESDEAHRTVRRDPLDMTVHIGLTRG